MRRPEGERSWFEASSLLHCKEMQQRLFGVLTVHKIVLLCHTATYCDIQQNKTSHGTLHDATVGDGKHGESELTGHGSCEQYCFCKTNRQYSTVIVRDEHHETLLWLLMAVARQLKLAIM